MLSSYGINSNTSANSFVKCILKKNLSKEQQSSVTNNLSKIIGLASGQGPTQQNSGTPSGQPWNNSTVAVSSVTRQNASSNPPVTTAFAANNQ